MSRWISVVHSTLTEGRGRTVGLAVWASAVILSLLTWLPVTWPMLVVVGVVTGWLFRADYSVASAVKVLRDWMGLYVFLTLYVASRRVADTLGMPWQERSMIVIDELLGGGETWVHRTQRWIDWDAPAAWWEVSFPLVYATHFLVSLSVLITLYVTNRVRWRQFMSRWVTLSVIGLVGYVLLPTVPPWLASERGTTAFVHEGLPRGWTVVEANFIADLFTFGRDAINPVAAMPSLHAAYPALLLLVFWSTRGLLVRTLLVTYCLFMGFTVVISGQHWVIDVIAGWACALAAHVALNRYESGREHAEDEAHAVASKEPVQSV